MNDATVGIWEGTRKPLLGTLSSYLSRDHDAFRLQRRQLLLLRDASFIRISLSFSLPTTMAKRLVHWALETLGSPSLPSVALPGDPADESTSTSSTEENNVATLQYVNSQLLAHGFTYQPGLSLEGTSTEDAEKVLKCLVAMLGQRVVRILQQMAWE
jgi:hypothetical protein